MTLTVNLKVPSEVAARLRAQGLNIEEQVNEAFALELYRQEKIDHLELSQMLGLDRFQTSALLQKHKIYVGALTMDDLESDYQTLKKLTNRVL